MAHFARTRGLGFWTLNSALLSSEAADLDTKTYKAINGDDGGAWSPAAAIQIGGSGIDMGGLLNIGSAGDFNAASGSTFTIDTGVTTTLLSAVTASGGGTLTGTWSLGGTNNVTGTGHVSFASGSYAEFLSGSSLDVDVGANVTISLDHNSDHINWTGTGATARWYTGSVLQTDAGASVTFNSAVTLAGAVTLSGATACSEPITMSSNGTIAWRAFLGTDADVTILADAYDEVHVVASTPTADRTYTLAGTAVAGQRFHISYIGGSYKITLSYNGGASSAELKNASTKFTHVTLTYISGSWRLTEYHLVP